MNHGTVPLDWRKIDPGRFKKWSFSQERCMTCALCSSACPVSGVDDFDPRKVIRMVAMGLENEVVEARWPWICTMCGKCAQVCPVGIAIPELMRRIRGLRERDKVPGILHKGLSAALDTGNNLGLPQEDFVFILEDVGQEIAEEEGFEDFSVPIDKPGAALLTTIHNKLVNTHTEDLKHWWKIFHAAGEDWTVAARNWEGTNWGYFTGDDEAMKIMAGRIAENMCDLKVGTLLWPE